MSTTLNEIAVRYTQELFHHLFPVISVVVGWFSTYVDWSRLEKGVERKVIAARGEVFYEQVNWDHFGSNSSCQPPVFLTETAKRLFGERHIRHVYIRRTQLSPDLAASIASLPYLEGFRADTAGMDAVSLRPFLKATNLRALEVMGNESLTDDAFVGLSNLRKLKILNVSRTGITDRTWHVVLELPELEVLDISRTKIEGKSSTKPKRKRSFRELSAERCQLSDEFGSVVESSPHLRVLFLKNASTLTDEAVAQFAAHPALEDLTLSNAKITDKSMELFAAFPKLKRLNVSNTKVTETAKERFRLSRDDVELR